MTFSYQWLRCNAPAGDGCTEIAGATGTSYTLTAADVGKRLRVRETAANAGGPGTPVESAPPAPWRHARRQRGEPLDRRHRSGRADPDRLGRHLERNRPDRADPPLASLRRRRAACDGIALATASTYVPVAADVGTTLKLEVTATNAGGSGIALSTATAPVAAAPGTGGGTGGDGGGTGGDGTGGDGSDGGSDPIPLSAEFVIGNAFKLSTVRTRGLPFTLQCNTACSVRAELLIPRKVAKRLGVAAAAQVRIGSGRGSLAAPGRSTVRVKLTKKASARLRRVRTLTATLRIVVADGLGTAASPLTTRVKLGR